ncbi:hypothetical protein ACKWTF_004126 [Chironomus riparius]
MYKYWHDQPPVKMNCYFFNWTNPEEFLNHSSTPKFEEVGPYTFLEYPRKANVTFHDHNSTVTYKKESKFIFDPEFSVGKMTDIITSPNLISLAASKQAQSFNILKVKGVELGLAFFEQKFHVTKTASELLFEGYEDSMIAVAAEIVKFMDIEVPFDDRYGWFYKRNESSRITGQFNADTSFSSFSELRHWTALSKPKFLESNCGSYKGASSDGLFPPLMAKNAQMISVFAHEMCRRIDLDFVEETEVNGINGRKFVSGDRMIDNGTNYPENECYCTGRCVPSGVLNITACRCGAPIFISYPHFYKGDQYYLDQVEGMKPDQEKHEMFMTLEPKTSMPLEVAGRFQINILVEPIPRIKMYRNVPTKFLPIVWFEQSFKIDNKMTFVIKLILWTPLIGQIIGFIIAVVSIYMIYKSLQAEKKEQNCPGKENLKSRVPELYPLVDSKLPQDKHADNNNH